MTLYTMNPAVRSYNYNLVRHALAAILTPHSFPDVLNSSEPIHHGPGDLHLHHQHDISLTASDAPADATDRPLNCAQVNSSSQSLYYSPSVIGTHLPPSPSAASSRSVGTHSSVISFSSLASAGRASYRRYERTTPHARSLHPYDNHSAANSHNSLSPIVLPSCGGLFASTGNNNEPGDPTPYTECPRFAQMTSSNVGRYHNSRLG